ncbi:MAG: hypothetical protein PVG22_15355 [Chromatiales bacterium]
MVKIVGFRRSGKSTLSETLRAELESHLDIVLMQNAATWLRDRPGFEPAPRGAHSSVDEELSDAFTLLEQGGDACWIVDDAEVLLAHATEGMLRNISLKISAGAFSLVLIRNRFVLEQSGWFRARESLIKPAIPKLSLEPFDPGTAFEFARSLCHGHFADLEAHWMVKMSGGIPGLISELSRYAPESVTWGPSEALKGLARQKRRNLRLDAPLRMRLLRALQQRILPPSAMLAQEPRAELGELMVSGMVRQDYTFQDEPFRGDFWSLVADADNKETRIPDTVADIALNLEMTIRKLDLAQDFLLALGLDPNCGVGDLALAFARGLVCQTVEPALVRPLEEILVETLGTFQIAEMLQHRGITASPTMSGPGLAALLLENGGR